MAEGKSTTVHPHFKDLTGQVFGRLTVIARAERRKSKGRQRVYWLCKCTCGSEHIAVGDNMRFGKSTSCGCLRREMAGDLRKKLGVTCDTHGMSYSPEFSCWKHMIQRCTNSSDPGYGNYGGRGISVCDRWRESFEDFLNDMGVRPSDEHSIDRYPDNNGNYEPGNCRWATLADQSRNRRDTVMITHDGKTMCLKDWASEAGLNYNTLRYRVRIAGWPIEQALKGNK